MEGSPSLSLFPYIVECYSQGKLIREGGAVWTRPSGAVSMVSRGEVVDCISSSVGVEPSIVLHAISFHNILSISKYYDNIYLDELAAAVGMDPKEAERLAAKLISEQVLKASIDRSVSRGGGGGGGAVGLLTFEEGDGGSFDDSIYRLCGEVKLAAGIAAEI